MKYKARNGYENLRISKKEADWNEEMYSQKVKLYNLGIVNAQLDAATKKSNIQLNNARIKEIAENTAQGWAEIRTGYEMARIAGQNAKRYLS